MKRTNLIKLLSKLRKLNIQLSVEEGRLRCKAPEGVLSPALCQEIAEGKAEILTFLQQVGGVSHIALPPIQAIPRGKDLPLSFAQERMWFLNQLEGSKVPYNEQGALRITGNLELKALEMALSEIVRRHELLRTSFQNVKGTPIQVIHPEATLNIEVVDLQQREAKERETVLHQQAQLEAIIPFDLERVPLIRCSLLHLDAREYVLLLTMHHIVFDGWSIGVFIQELSSLYQAFTQGEPSPLPELPIQYADFAIWQRQWLSGEVLLSQLNYWQQQLEGAPELLQLPTDRPRPNIQTHRGATQTFSLNIDLTQKLQTLSRESGTTLFMILQAAFATLLYRYSGQSDIVIGSPIANRHYSEIESLIGFFVNTLVLRTRFEDNPSFEKLLARVRETTLKAYEHQDVPFEQVVEALQPQRSLSHSPLFQVMFVLQNAPMGEVELPGVTLSELNLQSTIAKFDLTLSMTETDQGLVGSWEYNTDLFEGSTIERMAANFQNLLSAIVENPQRAVGELPLLSEAEQHQLLVEWNDTEREYPIDKCIHQLFEEQVERTPDAVAVVFEKEQLTYVQLNQRANQLAHHLQSLRVGPEVLVGICVERSLEMVVGLLGILKAGGAYVPLDPNYPQERLSYMLSDSGVEVLLTQQSLLESLPEYQAQVVCLDRDWGAIERHSQENLDVGVGADNLAYVIYTSGSTGVPKGVMNTHQGIHNRLLWMQKSYQLTSSDRVVQKTPFSFDVSVWEFFWPLLTGARIVVAKPEGHKDSTYLVNLISQQQITTIHFVPSMLQVFLQEPNLEDCSCLKRVICSGEALPFELTQRFFSQLSCELHNLYGPTEAAIDVTFWQCQPQENLQIVPIGRPISNTQIYILDEQLKPVPIGVAGELYIGGNGLARGYLNRPELTGEKFIPNPFDKSKVKTQKSKLYQTGDLARYLPHGNIEFLGRIDYQVKIRGFRIELGEIESVLNTHPQIQQVVVIATKELPDNKRLVAYIVTSEQSLSTNQLREFLKQKLPEYMIPSAFVTLDSLPLTPNGKVDRKALPATDGEIIRETEYVAPRTPREEIIANIFASVLDMPNVGIYDNFFELGGHSLLATQLISRLRVALDLEIPLRAVFESPTVAQLEPTLTQLLTTSSGLSLPPIHPRTEGEQLPLSWAQERLWFLDQLEGRSATYNMPAAVRITGNLELNAFQQALSEIVRRHEVLRTSFPSVQGRPIQVIHPEATLNIKVVDLQQLEVTEPETVLIQQAQQEAITPFNLEIAPLIRCSLWQLDAREYVLLLTMHHIVSDGWSMGVFIQELFSLYQAFIGGEPSPLPELPIQYADFAIWQRQWLSGEVLLSQIKYWQQQLAGAPELLQLPTDRPRPSVQTHRGATQTFSLNTDLTQKLQTLSRESGTTLFMTLQAAFATLLYRYSGQSDIVMGSPIANRHRREIEPLIGFFVNTLVIRTDLSGNPSFLELLRRVRSVTLDAYAHQDVPFEKLVEELQPERSLSYNPLFQVFFNMLNLEETPLELPGVKAEPFDMGETATSKFDLMLYISEKKPGIRLKLVYNAELFAPERMVEMLHQFHYLLTQIVAAPDNLISLYSLVTPESKPLLLDPSAPLPEPQYELVATMFTSWAKRTPEQPAICQGSSTWNYGDLSQTAKTLAKVLLAQGIKQGDVVAVSGTRSFGLIASMLGVFLSGGVLLSTDPKLPSHRQQIMLQEAQAKYILYVGSQLPDGPSIGDSIVNICIEPETGKAINPQKDGSQVRHLPEIELDDAAYIFFTSGTTGVPKGVLGCHKGLAHFLAWQQQTFEIGQEDRIAQLTGLSFDVVLRDIFLPLTSGATLCLPQEEDILEPTRILRWLENERISVLHSVPSLVQSWLTNVPSGVSLSNLRWLLFAGEPLKGTLVQQWREIFPQAGEIINLYGPTETTLAKCCYRVPLKTTVGIQSVGSPLPETQALVLGLNNQLCGIGEEGEIVIRTPFRSLGYINAPEENLSRFVKNPFGNDEQDLLYYTGDRGRYRPDGSLEILGRLDHQVKIRGVRIELGEIEAILSQHPAVLQCVVIATQNDKGDKRLVGYVIANSETAPTNGEIRQFLQQQLPEYMLPSAFVTLDSLPLTPNGKIDRKALPKPDGEITREQEYVAPRTQSEEIIANIFASVLGIQTVGIHDNFFELGGHSLLATQLISRLRVALDLEIPLRAVFEFPTVAQLDHTLTQLRTTNRGLSLPPIEPRTEREQLPLSWAQERLWFLNQLEGKSATYNMPEAVRITGNLDINALQQALSEIVTRHEVLRTSFPSVQGRPIQVIQPKATLNIKVVDLREVEDTEPETVLHQQAQQEATTPFDLERAPLIRCSLWQLDTREYVLLLTMHHIVSDGWSMGVFIQEISSLYQAFTQGEPSPLPELPIQYADFAIWQRQWLSGEVLENQLHYWQEQLKGAPELLQLPTDRPRPTVQNYRGTTQSFSLNTDLTKKLQTLSRNSGTTLFMVLHAALATLLYRYSGQSDILIGAGIANRNHSEIESLIGFFVNMLVLRTRFEDNPSMKSLLAQVRETTLKAYEHQDVPFEQVVEALQPQRSLSYAPLFQVAFVLQNTPRSELQLPNVTLTTFTPEMVTTKFDLTVSMSQTSSGLVGSWEYSTELFDGSTIERMTGHFQNLLSAIVENPSQKVGEFPLLSEAERHQLLVEWNETESEYPSDKCIHQLFEEQVERTPLSIAVVFEKEQLTYVQLNQRANQLAHHLQTLGVGPEVLVGIGVERSLEMVVGLLGILKAGGAYVPLDPSYPQERLSYMLADSGVEVLLTQQSLLESWPQNQAQVVCLDTDWGAIERHSQENLDVGVGVENLAYVIYTSGSTGVPKGVLVEHKNVVRLFAATQSWYHFNANDVWTNFHSIAFDFSVWEIWGALLYGGRLVIVPYWLAREPQSFYDLLCSEKVTVLNQTPSAFRQLINVEKADEGQPQLSLRLVIFGGEALELQSLKPWFEQHGDRSPQLVNMYGITETTVHVTYRPLTIQDLNSSGSVIGCPIPDLQMYILDDNLQPVPIGVKGQMYVGGAGVARGYLNREQLTLERFIPNPFNHQLEERLYQTGDVARYLPNGDIEYLGRSDNQVKVRGFRIELGEIEAVLNTHPQIQQAVVVAREELPGNKRLVAYVVSEPKNQSLSENPLQLLQIEQWQELYDDTYSESVEIEQPSYNTVGWKSSYTGNQIPQEQMRQWVDSTVAQILQWQPEHVLEIGCGTGMLLFQIAPHCLSYCGTDFSTAALGYVEQQIQQRENSYSHVSLSQKLAHDFTDIEEGRFDAVILNSVVQYFPSIDYLVEVLQGAVKTLAKGGFIFVGDVRSLPLLETFHTATKFERAHDSLTIDQLRQQVKNAVNQEEELALDPAFFLALKQHFPPIKQVQIQLKPGDYQNELTKFRYDVMIHVGQEVCSPVIPEWLEYEKDGLNLSALKQLLRAQKPEVVGIKQVPNARLQEEVTLVKLLSNFRGGETIGQLRHTLQLQKQVGVEPSNLWSLKDELPYSVYITWSGTGGNGCYDAIFIRNESTLDSQRKIPNGEVTSEVKAWSAYANNPLKQESNRHLVSQLPSFLCSKLPEYMVPSAFVTLETLPLTPNGKVDRQALPAPEGDFAREHEYVAPRTPREEIIANIFASVLGVPKVGIHDNFFELGGHSLLATQVISRVRQAFAVDVSLRNLFEEPTIANFSKIIENSYSPLVQQLQTTPFYQLENREEIEL